MNTHIERRLENRDAVSIKATAVAEGGLVRQEVLIVNHSRSGVMIQLPTSAALPDKFTLLFEHQIAPCSLVWRDGKLAGLRLID